MKKNVLVSLLSAISIFGYSQEINKGIKLLQNQKFQSAIESFSDAVKLNPSDSVASYWLTQSYLMNKQPDQALNFIKQNSLFGNSILLNISAIHCNINKGNVQNADKLQSIGKKLNTTVIQNEILFVALGRAYSDLKKFDSAYSSFNKAYNLNTANLFNLMLMGNTALKNGDGTGSYKSFSKAIEIDSNYAPAYVGLARIYISQKNIKMYLPLLNKAISKDSTFAPAWYEIYRYAYYNDKENLKKYYNKYLDLTDKTPKQEYQLLVNDFNSKKYTSVIERGKKMVDDKENNFPIELYRQMAFSYYVTKNIEMAYSYMENYMETQDSLKITNYDHYLYAQFAARTISLDSTKLNIIEKEFYRDTVDANKLYYAKRLSNYYIKKNDQYNIVVWKEKLLPFKKYNKVDMYNVGLAWYNINELGKADTILHAFITKYPKEFKGIYMLAGIKAKLDSNLTEAIAVPYFQEFVDSANSNTSAEYKPMLEQSYNYLGGYYLSLKDYKKALLYYDLLLKASPTNKDLRKTVNELKKYLRDLDAYKKSSKDR